MGDANFGLLAAVCVCCCLASRLRLGDLPMRILESVVGGYCGRDGTMIVQVATLSFAQIPSIVALVMIIVMIIIFCQVELA